MFRERRTVSRKTPQDGKLEVSKATAARLAALGAHFPLTVADVSATARVTSMECTCAKGAAAGHTHHFVESPVLATLTPGDEVCLVLDDALGALRVDVLPGAP